MIIQTKMPKSREKELKKKILKFLQKNRAISKREFARKLKISPATVSKYVEILKAEGKLSIIKLGNINIIEKRKI